MKTGTLLVALATIWVSLAPLPAAAHKESDAYLTLRTDTNNDNVLQGQWDIALRDLDFAIGIDSNHDGAITWGEVGAHRAAIERYALARLAIKGDGLACGLRPTGQMIDDHTDGAYNVIVFKAVCDKEIPNRIAVVYRLFDSVDPYHRGIVTVRVRNKTAGAVLGPENPSVSLNLRTPDRWRQFKSFVVDGSWHIWTGIDHMLFLLSLLLPSVLVRRRNEDDGQWPGGGLLAGGGGVLSVVRAPRRYRWDAVPSLWPASIETIKVVSAFTLSHSVTLTLAVLGIVDLPSRLVESGIALSVIVAAMNNIYPVMTERVWLIAFAFGFIHGLGFASALAGLQLPAGAMAASLGGFNVGVEIGQETIVLAFMPFAFLLRYTRLYRVYILRWGSFLIIAIAAGWFMQRAFDIVIPGFTALFP